MECRNLCSPRVCVVTNDNLENSLANGDAVFFFFLNGHTSYEIFLFSRRHCVGHRRRNIITRAYNTVGGVTPVPRNYRDGRTRNPTESDVLATHAHAPRSDGRSVGLSVGRPAAGGVFGRSPGTSGTRLCTDPGPPRSASRFP